MTQSSQPAMTTAHPFFAPLSGDVTQAFDIWSNWFSNVGQLGWINIDLGSTPDADLERRILERVGSYGRQLGRISEALEVMMDRADAEGLLDRSKLSDGEIAALHDFRTLVSDIKAEKERRGPEGPR